MEQSAGLFNDIEQQSTVIEGSVHEISAVIEEMIASGEQVDGSVQYISSGSQQLAATSQEISAIATEQAEAMNNMVKDIQDLQKLAAALSHQALEMTPAE